jgi:hypothetical protein
MLASCHRWTATPRGTKPSYDGEGDEPVNMPLLLSLSLSLFSCKTASVTEPWHIEITTDGGFTGRGVGSAAADSDHASDALRRAVAESKPQRWARDYVNANMPHGAPDEVHYTLTLTAGDHEYVTSWRDTAPRPRDLRDVADLVWVARTSAK